MINRTLRAVMALLLALCWATAAPAAIPPRPEGPVLDQADIIPAADEAALDARLRAYNQTTGRAVIVATVSSLDGEPIEMYGQALSEAWGIGGKETENGVLLLVAPNERKLRIATARGVQARFTDALSGRIIRDVITPRFKQGDFAGGISAGVDAITAQLDRDPADAQAVAEAAAAARAQEGSGDSGGASFGSIIFWIVMIVVFMTMFGGGRRGRAYRGGGINPGIVLWGASEIARGMSHGSSGGGFGGFGGGGGGGFGGFGGGGGGFNGGGASGGW